MSPNTARKTLKILGGCATAVLAAVIAILWFDLLSPPSDLASQSAVPTRAPIPTPTPTTLPPTPLAYLDDNFSSKGNWPDGGNDNSRGYTDQGYYLSPPLNGFTSVLLGFRNTSYRDLTLQVRAAPSSASGPIEYGVLFWHSIDKNKEERYIVASLSTSGYYQVRLRTPPIPAPGSPTPTARETPIKDPWADLVPSTRSIAINTGGEPNLLRVDVHPHRLLMFVNGVLVLDRDDERLDQYRDRPDFDGDVGLVALSMGEADARINFTEFQVFANIK